ncbi:hypothetical protein [Streptomyces sp. NPDC002994]|uniref:hypothetical protein n=1 Tax=Streptomyces sp. NPDC002994 TaxID=3154441 RepID=UPI00339F558E
MSEPTYLTVEQLLPLAVAIEHRQRQQKRGQQFIRRPLPPCPTCNVAPDEVSTGRPPNHFTGDLGILFEHCGHRFLVDDATAHEATQQAAQIVDQDEQRPAGASASPVAFHAPQPEYVIALRADDGTLIVGIRPDGSIARGPNYQPDSAAVEFWDAVTRAAQAAAPWRSGS